MKIGIVLASLPSISETFLDSKINGLQKMGHNVVIFSNKRGFYNQCPVIKNNLVENYDIFLILRMMVTYIKLFKPQKTILTNLHSDLDYNYLIILENY